MTHSLRVLFPLALAALAAACGDSPATTGSSSAEAERDTAAVRIGHLSNATHAHALVARSLSREDDGWFEARLPRGTAVAWSEYDAGPALMEALVSGSLDVAYVGPGPALASYSKSNGDEVRVLAGATRGGASLVVQGNGRIERPADFLWKKVAIPAAGNTQDLACRAHLTDNGLHLLPSGGDVTVVPVTNSKQVAAFRSGEVDAAWTVEPWVSKLEGDARGRILHEDDDGVTTVLVANAKFLRERPDVADRIVAAHRELTTWLVANPVEAQRAVAAELRTETGQEFAEGLLARCWPRMKFDDGIALFDFDDTLEAAKKSGAIRDAGNLARLVPSGP